MPRVSHTKIRDGFIILRKWSEVPEWGVECMPPTPPGKKKFIATSHVMYFETEGAALRCVLTMTRRFLCGHPTR